MKISLWQVHSYNAVSEEEEEEEEVRRLSHMGLAQVEGTIVHGHVMDLHRKEMPQNGISDWRK